MSDCLSRLPDETSDDLIDFNVNIAAIQGAELPCLTRSELASATASGTILPGVIRYTSTTWPKDINKASQSFHRFRNEFSVSDGLLLRGDRIACNNVFFGWLMKTILVYQSQRSDSSPYTDQATSAAKQDYVPISVTPPRCYPTRTRCSVQRYGL